MKMCDDMFIFNREGYTSRSSPTRAPELPEMSCLAVRCRRAAVTGRDTRRNSSRLRGADAVTVDPNYALYNVYRLTCF